MNKQLIGLVFLSGLIFASGANAQSYASNNGGIEISLNSLYDSHATAYAGSSSANYVNFHTDLKIGTTYPTGLYVGAMYSSFTNSTSSGATTSSNQRVGYGLTAGYHNAGYYLDATYLVYSKLNKASGEEDSGGIAYVTEFGYNTMMSSNFFVGVGLVYKSFSWTQSLVGGTQTGQNNSDTDFYPSLNIGFIF